MLKTREAIRKSIFYPVDNPDNQPTATSLRHLTLVVNEIEPWRPRSDRGGSPQEMYGGLIQEGDMLGEHKVIGLANGDKVHLVTTLAASPHTFLRAGYSAFEQSWRKVKENVPEGDLVAFSKSGDNLPERPTSVPLHMIVWAFVEDVEGNYFSLDPSDISSYEDANRDPYLYVLSENDPRRNFARMFGDQGVKDFYESLEELAGRGRAHLLHLYNNEIIPKIPLGTFLEEKTESDILQGYAIGYGGGDASKGLNQGTGQDGDGSGRGPMSSPTFHYHICIHLSQEELNQLNVLTSTSSYRDIIQYLRGIEQGELFAGDSFHIPLFDNPLESVQNIKSFQAAMKEYLEKYAKDIIKLIDPYSEIIFNSLREWLIQEAQEYLRSLGHVEEFVHHESSHAREFRSVHGVLLKTNGGVEVDRAYDMINRFIREKIASLWNQIREFTARKTVLTQEERNAELDDLQITYRLSDEMIGQIDEIMPTENQLRRLLASENERDPESKNIKKINRLLSIYWQQFGLLSNRRTELEGIIQGGKCTYDNMIEYLDVLLRMQMFSENSKSGLNIPGVPGFAVTHSNVNDHYEFYIGLLLSTKGLTEAWSGAITTRP